MPVGVYLNRIATAVPPHEVHAKFLSYVPRLIGDERERRIFTRLAAKARIERRFSVLEPSPDPDRLDCADFYAPGRFASTERRMKLYEEAAPRLTARAVSEVLRPGEASEITHLIITTCTGFYAPGLDLDLQRQFSLRNDLERSQIGFMGCHAAFNALKSAWHIVRSRPEAKVLIVNIELCSLHLQEGLEIEQLLAFMQFADGCAASIVSAEPMGLELEGFRSDVFPEGRELITWHITDLGFRMHLDPSLPHVLGSGLTSTAGKWLDPETRASFRFWAVHPGGRGILDAVEGKLGLNENHMRHSRSILRDFGNMSSATIMFVLRDILADPAKGRGIAIGFGPGLTMESMFFVGRS